MSMIYNVCSMSESGIKKLLASPEEITAVLYEDKEGFDKGEGIDLDKSWGGIHFLLTGADMGGGEPPLNFLFETYNVVGDVDVGYGPARAMMASDVAKVAAALSKITDEELKARFDPKKMTKLGIYPDIWDEGDEALEYCMSCFEELKKYIAQVASKKLGLLLWMN